MDTRRLRYFVAVAEELHFGRAAQRLGISQPPLSLHIRLLEEELGAQLLDRTSRRVQLTEVGRAFLGEACAALRQIEHAAATARRALKGEIGEIKIGLTESVPLMGKVPQILRAFREARPGVHLTLVEMLSRRQVTALEEGELHVGFLRTPGTEPVSPQSIESVALGTDPLVLFLPAAHLLAASNHRSLKLENLAGEPFVFYEQDVATGLHDPVIEMCRKAGFVPRITQEAREPTTILGLVSAGFGVTILPSSFARMEIEGVVAKPIAGSAPAVTTWLAHARAGNSPLTAAFLEVARGSIGIAQER